MKEYKMWSSNCDIGDVFTSSKGFCDQLSFKGSDTFLQRAYNKISELATEGWEVHTFTITPHYLSFDGRNDLLSIVILFVRNI